MKVKNQAHYYFLPLVLQFPLSLFLYLPLLISSPLSLSRSLSRSLSLSLFFRFRYTSISILLRPQPPLSLSLSLSLSRSFSTPPALRAHFKLVFAGQTDPSSTVDLALLIKPLPRGKIYAINDMTDTILTGSTFDLVCFINPGMENPADRAQVYFLKDGSRFDRGNGAKVIGWLQGDAWQDYQIRFFNFTVENAGVYSCHTNRGSVNASLTGWSS